MGGGLQAGLTIIHCHAVCTSDMKREANEGETKFNRMQVEAQLYESAKNRGDYLGTGSLTDYHGNFDLGLGWKDSPFHYNSDSLRDVTS